MTRRWPVGALALSVLSVACLLGAAWVLLWVAFAAVWLHVPVWVALAGNHVAGWGVAALGAGVVLAWRAGRVRLSARPGLSAEQGALQGCSGQGHAALACRSADVAPRDDPGEGGDTFLDGAG